MINTNTNCISASEIVERVQVRGIKQTGVDRLKEKMGKMGFLPQHPLLVVPAANGGYTLLDGNHRLEAALALGIADLPIYVQQETLSDNEQKRLARQANEAAETMVPTTFVDDAEFIWKEAERGKTQAEIGEIVGWSRDKVAKYDALKSIAQPAWKTIVTTFEDVVTRGDEDVVTGNVTTVTFTEGLLRSILDLTPEQQLELVTDLAHTDKSKRISKGAFKTRAENYQARNEVKDYALAQLGALGEPYMNRLVAAVDSGAFDAEWIASTDKKSKGYGLHLKLDKLIQSLRDEWEQKNSIHLIHGDFYEEIKNIGEGSIDLILTDPPYNVANTREFVLEGRSNISQDFGEWDKYEHEEFLALFPLWSREWARILRPKGSGYVFTSEVYNSQLRVALEEAGLHVKATIIWHKTNPGTQIIHTNFRTSTEHVLFFTKGRGGHTFNWQGENEMHNHIEKPICQGNERIKDRKGDTLHPTQKPESVISHFLRISSNGGDTVFDGFMGVGTTGKVAKDNGRKFIGIEQDQTFFEAACRRVE